MKRRWIQLGILLVASGCQVGPRPASRAAADPAAAGSIGGAAQQAPTTAAISAPGGSAAGLAAGNGGAPAVACPTIVLTAARQDAGGGAQEPSQIAPARPLKSVEAIPASAALVQTPASPAPGTSPVPGTNPAPGALGSLSLGEALATSLTQNPDLVTAQGAANVSAAMVDVAGVYPWNPFVQAQFFPNGSPFAPSSTPGGAAGQSNYYVWLMQRFELGHQRSHRKESAVAAFGQVRWNIRQVELTNIAQTERLYFTALYQRQLLDLAVDTETLAARLLAIVERRFQSGLSGTVEIGNARVTLRQARHQRQLADSNYQTAALALRQQMGLPADAPLALAGDLSSFEWRTVSDAYCHINPGTQIEPQLLAGELADARPDVMAARSAAAVSQANLSLARSARIQDVQAGPIYETADDGTRYLGLRLQRDFGVFNNGTALVSQREAELRQQVLAHIQLKRRASIEAAAAIDRYERARAYAAQAAAESTATQSRDLDQVIAQYEAGKADIINVLAIQNNLLLDVRASLDLFNELAQAAAMVTQTTGLPPERLVAPPRPSALPPVREELPPPAGR